MVGCDGPWQERLVRFGSRPHVRRSGLLDFGKPAISGKTSLMKTLDLGFGAYAE